VSATLALVPREGRVMTGFVARECVPECAIVSRDRSFYCVRWFLRCRPAAAA